MMYTETTEPSWRRGFWQHVAFVRPRKGKQDVHVPGKPLEANVLKGYFIISRPLYRVDIACVYLSAREAFRS